MKNEALTYRRKDRYELRCGFDKEWIVAVSWPPKTVPLFIDQGSFEEWHGNGIQMRMR